MIYWIHEPYFEYLKINYCAGIEKIVELSYLILRIYLRLIKINIDIKEYVYFFNTVGTYYNKYCLIRGYYVGPYDGVEYRIDVDDNEIDTLDLIICKIKIFIDLIGINDDKSFSILKKVILCNCQSVLDDFIKIRDSLLEYNNTNIGNEIYSNDESSDWVKDCGLIDCGPLKDGDDYIGFR